MRCAAHLNYWQFGDYIASAQVRTASTARDEPANLRWFRYRKSRAPQDYLGNAARLNVQRVAGADLVFEFLLNALRLSDAFLRRCFKRAPGWDLTHLQPRWHGCGVSV